MSVGGRVLRGLRAVVAADGLRLVTRGLVILVLTRYLFSPEEYGLFSLAVSVLGVAVMFSSLGLAKSAARFVPEFREREPEQIPHVLLVTLGFNLVTIALISLALIVGAGAIADLIGEPRLAVLLTIGVGFVAGRTLVTYSYVIFQGFNRVTWSAIVRGVESVAQFVFVIAFVLLGWGVAGAIWGYVVATVLAAVVGLVVLASRFYLEFDRSTTREDGLAYRILAYSIPLTATKGANVIDKRIDIILVGSLAGPIAAGYYTLARQVVDFVMAPARALGFTVSPTYGEDKARDELRRAARTYTEILEYTLLLYLPATVGIVLVARPAIAFVFGSSYLGAVPILQVLSAYVSLQAITLVTSDGLDYLGRARERAIAKGVTSLGNLGLNVVFITWYGAVGAAVATVFTHFVYVSINVAIVNRELDLPVRDIARSVARILAVTGLVAGTVLTLLPFVSSPLALIAVVAAAVAVWAGTAVLAGILDPARLADAL